MSSELTLEYPNVEDACGIKESGVNSIKPQPKKVIFTEDGI